MTKSATRRAVPAGWLERVFSQDAQTKLLHHKPRASTVFGAGPFIFRNANAQRLATFQRGGFTSRY
jgi:hypothetical protein